MFDISQEGLKKISSLAIGGGIDTTKYAKKKSLSLLKEIKSSENIKFTAKELLAYNVDIFKDLFVNVTAGSLVFTIENHGNTTAVAAVFAVCAFVAAYLGYFVHVGYNKKFFILENPYVSFGLILILKYFNYLFATTFANFIGFVAGEGIKNGDIPINLPQLSAILAIGYVILDISLEYFRLENKIMITNYKRDSFFNYDVGSQENKNNIF